MRLRDHGCEITDGMGELYVTLSYARPEKRKQYEKPIHELYDCVLKLGRNEHGMLYNIINPSEGTHTPGAVRYVGVQLLRHLLRLAGRQDAEVSRSSPVRHGQPPQALHEAVRGGRGHQRGPDRRGHQPLQPRAGKGNRQMARHPHLQYVVATTTGRHHRRLARRRQLRENVADVRPLENQRPHCRTVARRTSASAPSRKTANSILRSPPTSRGPAGSNSTGPGTASTSIFRSISRGSTNFRSGSRWAKRRR